MKAFIISLLVVMATALGACVELPELEYNAFEDPRLDYVDFSVQSTTVGPTLRNLRVAIDLRLNAFNATQRSRITGFRIYENDQVLFTTGNLEQRFFLRNDVPVGTTLTWEYVLMVGLKETASYEGQRFTYTVQ